MNQLNFYNTINAKGDQLKELQSSASNQNQRILYIFKLSQIPMTPFEVHKIYCKFFPECPITSIRRALTSLTNQGKLIKTSDKKIENYGVVNYKWKLG